MRQPYSERAINGASIDGLKALATLVGFGLGLVALSYFIKLVLAVHPMFGGDINRAFF